MADTSEVATKADIAALDRKIDTVAQRLDNKIDAVDRKIDAMEQRFEGKLDASEQRIMDRMAEIARDTETRLLQAFYGFAEATNKRATQADLNLGLIIGRMASFESRLLEVEKRLHIPPAA